MTSFAEALAKIKIADFETDVQKPCCTDYRNNSYNVVSTFGYLIGVEQEQFYPQGGVGLQENIYKKLKADRHARIIRNLCRVRTALLRNYSALKNEFKTGLKSISYVPEYVPQDAIWELSGDNVHITGGRADIDQYLITINNEIANRIANVRAAFPEWLNWSYIRKLFVMPQGNTKAGINNERTYYNSDRNRYPYQAYMNWDMKNTGNILYCDEKFVTLLYTCNEDIFTDLSLVRNAGDLTVNDINTFIESAGNAIFVVDCENSNPVKLASVLGGLPEELKSRIKSVLLFDSHYTTEGWGIISERSAEGMQEGRAAAASVDEDMFDWDSLSQTSGVRMEHIVVDRLLENKSQVDMTLAVRTTQEVYKNGVDSVVLVSSDSDYWAMIQNLTDVKFMVMLERMKTSPKIKESLDSKGIRYCFLDDFYTGVTYSIKTETLKKYIQNYFDQNMCFDAASLLQNAVHYSWIEMTEKEKAQFMEKYLKKSHIEVDSKGMFRVVLGEK